jgi:hypothetical protein
MPTGKASGRSRPALSFQADNTLRMGGYQQDILAAEKRGHARRLQSVLVDFDLFLLFGR